ncbi:DUF6415 family natural product biosynthesis protein [Streptomyces sp. NPDC012623]|uniref:DUF6415 family natural product biosynthesis protein n=1 Tax=unclassified Streptomyces TaxID=2593676 RepID=UPI003682C7FC
MVDPSHAPACVSTPARPAIEATLAEAAGLAGLRASPSELATVTVALRQHIEAMIPAAEAHAATLWRGGHEWYGIRSTLDGIRAETEQPAKPLTRMSGYVRLELLRRWCEWLLEHYGPDATQEDRMFCAYCNEPILPGQAVVTAPVETGSGAAPEVTRHRDCRRDPWAEPNRAPFSPRR